MRDQAVFSQMARQESVAPSVAARPAKATVTLQRGEKLWIVRRGIGETAVRLSDGQEGFVATRSLVEGPDAGLATLLFASSLMMRPDLLAPKISDVKATTLLLVLNEHEGFSRVEMSSKGTGWILTTLLSRAPREILAASLVARAPTAPDGLAALVQSQLTDTQVFRLLERPPATASSPSDDTTHRMMPGAAGVLMGSEPPHPFGTVNVPGAPPAAPLDEAATVTPDSFDFDLGALDSASPDSANRSLSPPS